MVINFGNIQNGTQSDGFMDLCTAHPDCSGCELSDGQYHEVNGIMMMCNTAHIKNNNQE